MKGYLLRVNLKALAFLNLNLMSMKDNLKMESTMGKESILGFQATSMRANTNTGRSLDLGFIAMLTDRYTKVIGLRENAMGKESKFHLKEQRSKYFSVWE